MGKKQKKKKDSNLNHFEICLNFTGKRRSDDGGDTSQQTEETKSIGQLSDAE